MKRIALPPLTYVFLLTIVALVQAQDKTPLAMPPQPPAPIVSPEVHADGSVTFRLRAPNAVDVKLEFEGSALVAMQKDGSGAWSLTTPPLSPDYYGYSFLADGVRLLDPENSSLIPNLLTPASAVHVPGPLSLPWELNDVPHGEVHHHFYKSKVAGDDRDYYVYTPADYDPAAKTTYPCALSAARVQ
jgi:hypothetical protein